MMRMSQEGLVPMSGLPIMLVTVRLLGRPLLDWWGWGADGFVLQLHLCRLLVLVNVLSELGLGHCRHILWSWVYNIHSYVEGIEVTRTCIRKRWVEIICMHRISLNELAPLHGFGVSCALSILSQLASTEPWEILLSCTLQSKVLFIEARLESTKEYHAIIYACNVQELSIRF